MTDTAQTSPSSEEPADLEAASLEPEEVAAGAPAQSAATGQVGRWLQRWSEELFDEVPIDSLAFVRVCFGLVLAVDCWIYLQSLLEMRFGDPIFHFTFPYFHWVQAAPLSTMRGIFYVLLACSLLILAGRAVRVAAGVFAVLWAYVLLADKAFYNNHDYLIALLALTLVLVPSTRHTGGKPRSTVPQWALRLMQFEIALPYVYGAFAKVNYDWLIRFQPMKTWLQNGRTEGGLFFSWFGTDWAPAFFSWGGFLLDLLIVPALIYRRTRLLAFAVALGFHVFNSNLFDIGIFPWLMIGLSTIFFDPQWPQRLGWHAPKASQVGGNSASRGRSSRKSVKKRSRREVRAEKAAARALTNAPLVQRSSEDALGARQSPRRRLALAALGLWCFVQLVVPLRHFLYTGWVDWTEEGHTFSWRMKIRDKVGRVDFVLVDPVTGDFQPIREVDALLTSRQSRAMLHDPDMIRQFAVYLRGRLARAGFEDREVRVVTAISLNGRPMQQMILPTVDLSRLPAGTPRTEWMVPLQPLVFE